ncbi:MAG: ThuA domain-containing protein [Bacteroidota bacterium]
MTIQQIVLLMLIAPLLTACPKDPYDDTVLVFAKTDGYVHESIAAGMSALVRMGYLNEFNVETSQDASLFTSENLKRFKAVVFLNTTGDILNNEQEEAFQQYIQNGGGFVGIHAAADTEYDWPWYGKLVGAYFESHPDQQTARIDVIDRSHGSTQHLPEIWEHFDEWYNYKQISSDIKVLATLDEDSYKGGNNGDFHPIAWYQEFDGGRMFYTGLGHVSEVYKNEKFLTHLLGGIEYVMGR